MKRVRNVLAVTVTAVMVLLAAPAVTFAEVGVGSPGDVNPGGNGSTPGGGTGGTPTWTCWKDGVRTPNLWESSTGKIYKIGHPACTEDPTYWSFPGYSLCPTGLDTWRFWGTNKRPIVGWSVSRVNFDEETRFFCTQNHVKKAPTFVPGYPVHPDDAGNPKLKNRIDDTYRPYVTSREVGARFAPILNTYLTNEDMALRLDAAMVSPQIAANPSNPAGPLTAINTQIPRYNSAGNRTGDYRSYTNKYGPFTSMPPFRTGGEPCTAISTTGKGELPCSEVEQFTAPEGSKEVRYVGFCYAATASVGSTYLLNNGLVTATHNAKLGARYDVLPGANNSNDVKGVTNVWRDRIAAEVGSRSKDQFRTYAPVRAYIGDTGYSGLTEEQFVNKYRLDRSVAARWAAKNVRCQTITINPPTDGGSDETIETEKPTVHIKISGVPDTFQVGGSVRPFSVTGTPILTCNGGPCPKEVQVRKLRWTLQMKGSPGFDKCSTRYAPSCDWWLVSSGGVGGRALNPVTATAWFYRTTTGAQSMNVTAVVDPGAQVSWVERTIKKEYVPTLVNGVIVWKEVVTVTTKRVTGPLTVTVDGPYDRPVIGAVRN